MRFVDEYNPEIRRYIFEYEDICTIKEMLEDFLRKTNSKKTLAPSDICFVYNSTILNTEKYINKRLKEVFKKNRIQCNILVYETN